MSQPPASRGALVRVSVPAEGDLRAIVPHLAVKVTEFLGQTADLAALVTALDAVAARVAPDGAEAEITFEFRHADSALLIEARSGGRSSEVRCPLPA